FLEISNRTPVGCLTDDTTIYAARVPSDGLNSKDRSASLAQGTSVVAHISGCWLNIIPHSRLEMQ
ncbi:hypothetical protein L195_g063971, partial [Trifolium pratense]